MSLPSFAVPGSLRDAPPMPRRPRRIPAWLPATVFTALAAIIGAIGIVTYDRLRAEAKHDVHTVLGPIASSKIEPIERWRTARLGDGQWLIHEPAPTAVASRWHATHRLDERERIRATACLRSRQFAGAAPIDTVGTVIPSTGGFRPVAPGWPVEVSGTLESSWQDIDRARSRDGPRPSLVVPMTANAGDRPVPMSAPYLQIDPARQFLPLVQHGPTGSQSAETLLIRVDGGRGVRMTASQHSLGRQATERPTVDRLALLLAEALGGHEGALEGDDHRGVLPPVVGQGSWIDGSPWFRLSTVDAAEVYGVFRRSDHIIVAIALSALLLCALTLLHWWRHRRSLLALERRYADLMRCSNDVILLLDERHTIVEINARTLALYGRPPMALIGRDLRELCHPDGQLQHDRDWQTLDSTGALLDSVHVRGDGSAFPVEISVRTLAFDGRRFHQAVIRDVSERRRLEDRMSLYSLVFDATSEAVLITDAAQRIVAVNPAFIDITGYSQAEVLGRTPRLLSSGRQDREFYARMWTSLAETGRWQGEIWNRRKDGRVYPEWQSISAVRDVSGAVTHYVALFSDISDRKETEERMRHLAQHDPLTDLPNRVLMHDRLQQALSGAGRSGAKVALILIDLDRFKNINDSLGHPAGDQLLQGVASRLRGTLRDHDTVCRLGGDEFLVIIPTIGAPDEAALLADRILAALADPFHLCGHDIPVTPSIGVSLFPDDGTDIDTLMRNADTAMYQAKEKGRNGYQFFTPDMNRRVLERLTLEADMRVALTHGEFGLFYQPQIDMKRGQLIGMEALVRWHSPRQGIVSPARFIAVAEESGLIIPLGEQILRMACEQRMTWLRQGWTRFPVSVNVSPIQFRDTRFDRTVARVLRESGLPPGLLDLELTESAVMHERDETDQMLQRLKALGITLSIDDFGTGYSSLAYLKRFPIDRLKIDQSFVRDVLSDANDVAIIHAIIALGHSLNLRVIAEGVETPAQFTMLRDSGCDECQGYLIGRPAPPGQAFRWMDHVTPWPGDRRGPGAPASRNIPLIAYAGRR